jgi:hypothetical protein
MTGGNFALSHRLLDSLIDSGLPKFWIISLAWYIRLMPVFVSFLGRPFLVVGGMVIVLSWAIPLTKKALIVSVGSILNVYEHLIFIYDL